MIYSGVDYASIDRSINSRRRDNRSAVRTHQGSRVALRQSLTSSFHHSSKFHLVVVRDGVKEPEAKRNYETRDKQRMIELMLCKLY